MPLRVRAEGSVLPIDRDEVKRALRLLASTEPGHHCQLVALPGAEAVSRPGVDVGGLVEAAGRLTDRNVYITLNPVKGGLHKKASSADVLQRRWLFLDIDRWKGQADKNDPATDQEKEQVRLAAEQLRDYLASEGWPAPILIDSGNGWYLLWRCHLPADSHTQAVVRAWTHAMGARVKELADVDRAVHNADRIAALPGTMKRKGTPSDDRPWRPVRLVYVPDVLEVVSHEQIVDATPQPEPAASSNGNGHAAKQKGKFTLTAGSSAAITYVKKAVENCCAMVALARPGTRNDVLNKAAYSLGGFIPTGHLKRSDIEEKLTACARQCGLHEDPDCGEGGIARSIQSGIDKGMAKPRQVFGDTPPTRSNGAADAVPASEPIIIRASSITPRMVEWLWPLRIPRGKLTTFAGVGGLGKTFVLCDIVARVTAGLRWPDEAEGQRPEPGQVLFISGEDEADDTLVPRMIEMGADLNRVLFLKTEVQDAFTLADLKTLDRALDEAGSGLQMVAIDPPTAYLGGVNDHRNAELRQLLTPLKTWAARRRVAIVFNTHVNKPQGAKVEAMMRVMGSVAWVNAVRAAHLFARDPQDHERRLFCSMKLNIGREAKGLAYRILPTDALARIEWLGEVDVTADEAINRERGKRRGVVATAWLEQLFAQSSEIHSDVIWKEKDNTDLSRNKILEAKDHMGIKARQVTDGEGQRQWVWYWPEASRRDWEARKSGPDCSAPDGEESF